MNCFKGTLGKVLFALHVPDTVSIPGTLYGSESAKSNS